MSNQILNIFILKTLLLIFKTNKSLDLYLHMEMMLNMINYNVNYICNMLNGQFLV